MKIEGYDFSGWATKNDIKCADGRVIRHNAFKANDGAKVPLIWNHKHDSTHTVLGHAILENRDDGVFTYGFFNGTQAGQEAKELLRHGDIESLSIYANNLVQEGRDVLHGAIREVSLVLAGANPGAFVESVMAHGEPADEFDEEALIYSGSEIILPELTLEHAEKPKKKEEEPEEEEEDAKDEESEESEDVEDDSGDKDDEEEEESEDENKKKKNKEDGEMAHSAEAAEKGSDKTLGEVFDSMTDEQKAAVYAIIADITEGEDDDDNEDSDEEDKDMKHNLFDGETNEMDDVLQHSMILGNILEDAKTKKATSLRDMIEEAVNDGELAHAVPTTGMDVIGRGDWRDNIPQGRPTVYGFNDPEALFPEPKAFSNTPEWIQRNQDWVTYLLGAVHRSPFSRIKSVYANITEDEARAKGYIKTHQKTEEIFSLLKRVTTPTTIYKKQRMDRDDVIDITDFDVVAWIKGEMRLMLNEEIARAILLGDGRQASSDDKINESNIRPIATDVDLYTIKCPIAVAHGATGAEKADAIIDGVIRSRSKYRGSGNPILFTTEDWVTEMLLLKDGIGHRLYKTEAELATALRVSRIVTVEVMENATIPVQKSVGTGTATTTVDMPLMGVIVNPLDYNVGADKGGSIETFDDFDIDFNQYKWLMETRISGALTKPFSAISVYIDEAEG